MGQDSIGDANLLVASWLTTPFYLGFGQFRRSSGADFVIGDRFSALATQLDSLQAQELHGSKSFTGISPIFCPAMIKGIDLFSA